MSDFESEELTQPGCSDSESEQPGKSSSDQNQRKLCVNVCTHSADLVVQSLIPSMGEIRFNPFTRSAHYKGNWGSHVPPEEEESCKGEELLETPTLTTPRRNTPSTFSCHRGWAMGRERGVQLEGVKISTILAARL